MLFRQRCEACGDIARVLCASCRTQLFAMVQPDSDLAVVGVAYESIARRLILKLKYHNRRQVVSVLVELLAQRVTQRIPNIVTTCDVVTWAPTSSARVRRRGHDQSELLARRLARVLGVPCRRLLIKTSTNVQTGASREERLQLPHRSLGKHPPCAMRLQHSAELCQL